LAQHKSLNSHWIKDQPHPSDREFEVYIASHYGSLITNSDAWTSAITMTLIKGDERKFAERSVADYPAPTPEETKEADTALKKQVASFHALDMFHKPWFPLFLAWISLIMYVCIPAVTATLLFRGGLVLLAARVSFVRNDGVPASRLRLLWRAIVTWSPVLLVSILAILLKVWFSTFNVLVIAGIFLCVLAVISVALPDRGLQDRLAGVWPVSR
jgi:hypothetical protein